MNSPKLGLQVASGVFGIIGLVQLLRLVTQLEVVVAGHPFPLWPNAIAFVVAAGLSYWTWKLSNAVGK